VACNLSDRTENAFHLVVISVTLIRW